VAEAKATQAGEPTRRDMLFLATGVMGAVGVAGVAVPFIRQLAPNAQTIAAGAPIEVALPNGMGDTQMEITGDYLIALHDNQPGLREQWTVLAESLDAAGHTRVRQMTTVGGSVGPLIGGFDLPVALVGVNGRVVTASPAGQKTHTLAEAFDTRFAKDEMVIAVEVDALPPRSGSAFHKFLPRGVIPSLAARLKRRQS
jgi:hypothetical protein